MDLVAFYAVDTIHRCKMLSGRIFASRSILVSGLSKLCRMFEVCVLDLYTVESIVTVANYSRFGKHNLQDKNMLLIHNYVVFFRMGFSQFVEKNTNIWQYWYIQCNMVV